MFKYFLYRFGQFVLNHLSIPTSYRIAEFLSEIQYYCSFRDRRAVITNLKCIVPEGADYSKLAKGVFRNFGRYLAEFFLMERMVDVEFIKKNVKIKNLEKIQEVLSHGKGMILTTAHMGNWELGAVLLSTLGYKMMAVALPHKERPVNDLFNHQREVKGITVVPTNIAVRRCLENLKENKVVALVADRDFFHNGIVIDFLGKKTMIPKGPALFSIKTGAPIVPSFLIRQGDGTFVLNIEEPIFPPNNGAEPTTEEQLVGLMEKYIRVIEKYIRQNPSQWLMFREFWVK